MGVAVRMACRAPHGRAWSRPAIPLGPSERTSEGDEPRQKVGSALRGVQVDLDIRGEACETEEMALVQFASTRR